MTQNKRNGDDPEKSPTLTGLAVSLLSLTVTGWVVYSSAEEKFAWASCAAVVLICVFVVVLTGQKASPAFKRLLSYMAAYSCAMLSAFSLAVGSGWICSAENSSRAFLVFSAAAAGVSALAAAVLIKLVLNVKNSGSQKTQQAAASSSGRN